MNKASLDLETKYEHLPWDSKFFDFPVGKIIVNEYNYEILNSHIKKSKDRLLYIFDNTFEPELENSLRGLGAVNYDSRVEFEKELDRKIISTDDPEINFYSGPLNIEIEELAYSCGKYSRFALDKKLHKFFKPLYKRWIMNSLDQKERLLTVERNKKIIALLSFSLHEKTAKIELFSVNRKNTGKGLGSRLFLALEKYLIRGGINRIVVAAQKENDGACRFYEKCGFKRAHVQKVFHLWRS